MNENFKNYVVFRRIYCRYVEIVCLVWITAFRNECIAKCLKWLFVSVVSCSSLCFCRVFVLFVAGWMVGIYFVDRGVKVGTM